jgi:hypothetical protein
VFLAEEERVIPRDRIERILELDDLDPRDRVEVEATLASHPEARELLERIRSIEREKGPRGEIPSFESHHLDWESPRARDEAHESLRLLLERVVGIRGESGAPTRRPKRRAPWMKRISR